MGQNATTHDPIYGPPHTGRRHSMSPFSVPGRYNSTLDISRRKSMKNSRNAASTIDLDKKSDVSDLSEHDNGRRKPRESILEQPQLINVNTASEEELMTLPGVDRTVARAIVQRRQFVGPFDQIDDLVAVSGVGKKKLKRIRSEISTGSTETGEPAADCGHLNRDSADSGVFSSAPPAPEETSVQSESYSLEYSGFPSGPAVKCGD